MLRAYSPMLFFGVFIGWILYRLFVKRDLKENLNNLYIGLSFTGIWIVIYYLLLE